jgi:glyoxylase-like metal-dependent hydrolase (beta-lactamase superfamily II)
MTELTRRTILSGAAAIGATAFAPNGVITPAEAAAPPARQQAPGWYRYKVGDFEITVATDGARSFPLPDTFVKNAKKEEVNKALADAYMEQNKMTIPYTPIVVNTGSKLVVIDTGNGPAARKDTKANYGQFPANLKASGIDPKNVDIVLISHFHADHVNGLYADDGSLQFPNAEIKVPAKEYAYWMDDGEMSRAPKGRMEGLFKNNRRVFSDAVKKRVTQYDWDKEVAPGITAVGTPGHTPGHTSYVVSSGKGKLYVQSDVTNHPALFVRNPRWHAFFDQDAAMAEATRLKVYDMVSAEKMPMQGFHYPFPALGHIDKTSSGYVVIPVQWTPTL